MDRRDSGEDTLLWCNCGMTKLIVICFIRVKLELNIYCEYKHNKLLTGKIKMQI